MTIKLGPSRLEHIEGAPLKLALAQVRFAPVHAIEKAERVADFQDVLPDAYVGQPAQRSAAIAIQFGQPSPAEALPPPSGETIWPFRDPERGWSVILTSSSLALEASTYEDFDDFLAEFRTILTAFVSVFAPKLKTRLGLRYVNEVTDPKLNRPGGISKLFRKELVSPIGTELGSDLIGSLSELRFRETHGTFVLRHGLIADASYLLDFDYYEEAETQFEGTSILETIEAFHDLIEPMFIWCLNPQYLSQLKKGSRGR